MAGRKLVIVESPAKARTIAGYLGSDWDVEASVGHIRDIPTPSEMPAEIKKGPFGRFGVNVDADFEPYYVVDADKRKKVRELKALLKNADELYLATDEDREGEAIAWHLLETLQPKVPVKRMVFHEITKEAIQRAANTTRDVDVRLVDAQETRRILDRLYGYEVSPVLWRKVKAGLSAGRVQSVATRLVVERERERMKFRTARYWDVEADVTPGAESDLFTARLTGVDGSRVATGRDFADDGTLKNAKATQLDEVVARGIATALHDAQVRVAEVSEKPYTRRPSAPFTTSTLQQEASRKLRLNSRNAMRVAQRLYENGYITYMRTDSTTLSDAAHTAARNQARDLYGAEYVPDAPRRYEKKVKNAQEAHEAIRPSGDRFRTPAQVKGELRGEEFALYELIWKRTVASQMADARGSTASVRLAATLTDAPAREVELSASGTVITFRGFLAAYEEGRDDSARRAGEDEERRLPRLGEGTALRTVRADALGHETSPPARYTEATLVKAMEEMGIGRPSTYASTIGTIQDRGYVSNRGSALVPSWLAFAVTRLMEVHFSRLVDYDFTASMEEDLDAIARGDQHRAAWLHRFYFGDEVSAVEGLRDLVADLGDIDARAISTIDIGDGIVVRVGRYGPYVEETVPPGVDPATGEVTDASAGRCRSRTAAPRHHQRRHRARRADAGEGPRAARRRRRRRSRPRHRPRVGPRDRRAGGALRAVRHRGPARGRRARHRQGQEGGGQGQAAHRIAVQGHGPRDPRARCRAAPALAAPRRRVRPGVGGGDHRAERAVRAVPEEGHRLALAHRGAPAVRHHARGGAGHLRAAQAAWSGGREAAAGRARHRPRVGQAGRRQGRAVRPLRHRRRDQRDAAQGRRPGAARARARVRAARRQAGARSGEEDGQEDCEEGPGEEGRRQEGSHEEDRDEEVGAEAGLRPPLGAAARTGLALGVTPE